MMGLILQSRGLEAAYALGAAAMCAVVAWKSVDYILTMRRERREDRPSDPDA
jgi:hypothetical protein